MSINLTDEIEVKTKKGKLGAAKQIFLEGDTQTVEKEIQDINSRHNTLNTKHESLSRTVQSISVTGGASTATNVTYNNDISGLNAENAQDAIDEVSSIAHFAKKGGVVNISTNYNSDHIAEILTLSQALSKVPMTDRVLGFQGKYLATDGWHTIIYTGNSLTDWGDTTKWTDLADKVFNSISKNSTFAGIATPTTNPGKPDGPVFYIATTSGSYSNFNNIEVLKGETVILQWNSGTWVKSAFKPMTDFNSVFDSNGNSLTYELNTLGSNISELEGKAFNIDTNIRTLSKTITTTKGAVVILLDNVGYGNFELIIKAPIGTTYRIYAFNRATENEFDLYPWHSTETEETTYINPRPDLDLYNLSIQTSSTSNDWEGSAEIRKANFVQELSQEVLNIKNVMSAVSKNFFNSDNDDFEYVTLANLEKEKNTMIIDYLGKVNCEFFIEGSGSNSFNILATNKATGSVLKLYDAGTGADLPISFVNPRPDLEFIDVKIVGTSKSIEGELKIYIRKSSVIRELKENAERCEVGLSKIDKVTEGFDSANLYDPSKDVIGNLTTSGTIDATSTNFKVSDFIFIKAGENFVIPTYTNYEDYDGVYGYGIWDINKNWIIIHEPTASDIERGYMTDPLSNDGYIRIKLGKNAANIMVNKGTTPLPYTPFIEPSAIDKKAREEVSKKASLIDLKKTNDIVDSIVDIVTYPTTISGTSLNINKTNVIDAVIFGNDGAEAIHTNKNIIKYPYDGIQTGSGITFTTNPDGSVTVVGTANGNSKFFFIRDDDVTLREPIKTGQYMLSGCPNGGSNSTYKIIFGLTGVGEFFEYGDGKLIDVANDGTYYCSILIYAGQTVNLTFHPQLERGTTKTEYTSPKKEHIILSSELQNVKLYDGENYFDSTSIMTCSYKTLSQSVILNVKYYGAVGDGVTDDTRAINRALTDATNGVLFIPEGTYLFSGTLFVHTGTKVFGCGANSLLKLADTFSLSSVTWRGDTTNDKVRKPMILLDADSTGCILENFALEGQTYQDHYQDPDDNEDGICVMGSNHILNNLIVHNINYFKDKFVGRKSLTPGWGIDILRAKNISVTNCHVYDCGYENIGTEEADTILISGCRFGDANQTRAQIHRLSQSIKFVNNTCYATENARKVDVASFTMDANPDVPMDDIKVLNNTLDTHINKVASGENNISIIGNTIKAYGIVDNFKDKWGTGLTITDNVIFGRIGVWSDKALIANNRIEWSNPNYGIAIHVQGNQTLVANNLFTGTYTNVVETPHS